MNTKRIIAFFIDFIITAVLFEIPFFFLVMHPIISGTSVNEINLFSRALFSSYLSVLYFVFRDIPKNGSIGKKVMKLRIVNLYGQEGTSMVRRILRNITWLLGVVEIIIFLIAKKRLGDIIAKTDVVNKETTK